MAYEKDPNELGVLWEKTGGKGQYFTGSIEIDGVKHPVVVFKNTKRSDKAPDWRIMKPQPHKEATESHLPAPREASDADFEPPF